MRNPVDFISLLLGIISFSAVLILRILKYGLTDFLVSPLDLAFKSILAFTFTAILSKIIFGLIFKKMEEVEKKEAKEKEEKEIEKENTKEQK